jgi:transcriptional regulator with XRE-family HTH domain
MYNVTGIDNSKTAKIENAKNNPTLLTIWKLTQGLNVSLSGIFDFKQSLEKLEFVSSDDSPLYEDGTTILIDFGRRLRRLRIFENLTLRKLTFKSKIDNSKIAKMEKGLINPTLTTICQLVSGLGFTLKEFFDYKTPPGRLSRTFQPREK